MPSFVSAAGYLLVLYVVVVLDGSSSFALSSFRLDFGFHYCGSELLSF